jgi:biotin carboxylase
MSNAGKPGSLLLLMRRNLRPNASDHVQTLLDLGVDLHLVTSAADDMPGDPRFVSSTALPANLGHDQIVPAVSGIARAHEAAAVITFSEYDIVIAGEANERLGVTWARPTADRISRDKSRQRAFLAAHQLPGAWCYPVTDPNAALDVAAEHGFPLVVKPTRAASSTAVQLVAGRAALKPALDSIAAIDAGPIGAGPIDAGATDAGAAWALLEEYVPGREVTLDGVVLDGQFILGGIHDKALTNGPFFEEDLYTLPFSSPEREPELVAIAENIVKYLGLDLSLFNAELREDRHGEFRVIEFSTRVSGGHVFRNVRDVYGIDLLRIYARSVLGEAAEQILSQENARRAPRMATCIKRLYADGRVVRNNAGHAIFSPNFRAYYPMAKPGRVIASAPRGFDTLGALSVWLPWSAGQAPDVAHQVALTVAAELDAEIAEIEEQQWS